MTGALWVGETVNTARTPGKQPPGTATSSPSVAYKTLGGEVNQKATGGGDARRPERGFRKNTEKGHEAKRR